MAVTAELDVDFAKEKMVVFDQAWRLLRDDFFDPAFNGVDWAGARARTRAVHRRRAHAGRDAPDLVSLMIGELNASHLGISAPPAGAAAARRSDISGSTSIARSTSRRAG